MLKEKIGKKNPSELDSTNQTLDASHARHQIQ